MFEKKNFISHSGMPLLWKIECDSLSNDDWKCLAFIISEEIKFGEVEGVPRGGIKLAKELEHYKTDGGLLIVDDVLTTSKSMEKHRAGRDATGVVVFARGTPPDWIKSVFRYSLN